MYILNHKIFSLYGLAKYLPLGLLVVLWPLLLFDSNQNLWNLKKPKPNTPFWLKIESETSYSDHPCKRCLPWAAAGQLWAQSHVLLLEHQKGPSQTPTAPGERSRDQAGGEHLPFLRSIMQDCGVLTHLPKGFLKLDLCLFHTQPHPLIRPWKEQPVHPCSDGLMSFLENSTLPDWGWYFTPSSSLFHPLGMQSILC